VPRSPSFYFGSIIFFLGVLLAAFGVSKVLAGAIDLLTAAELVSGIILIIIGSRAVRSPQR
jgi:uncharacterized membrane protein